MFGQTIFIFNTSIHHHHPHHHSAIIYHRIFLTFLRICVLPKLMAHSNINSVSENSQILKECLSVYLGHNDFSAIQQDEIKHPNT